MKKIIYFLCLICVFDTSYAQSKGCNTIIERYRTYLFALEQFPEDSINRWTNSLSTDGNWPDINYKSKVPSGWDPSRHLLRTKALAASWTSSKSKFYGNNSTRTALNAAIDHWLQYRYQSTNWWHNQIGVPQLWRDIIVLTRGSLSVIQWKSAMEVLSQYRLNGTGANLIWSADLALHSAALSNNEDLVERASKIIANEIKIGKGDGIQPDFSFHQHGARLQTHHYGSSFLKDNIRLAWQLQSTPWKIPDGKIEILTNFVLEGWQWMARGIHTVPGTLDRAVSRQGFLLNADLRVFLPYLLELAPASAKQLQKLLKVQHTNSQYLQGHKTFPYSDFAAHQQKDFSNFLKTISTRTLVTEKINLENSKGTFLNFGDSYSVKNGQEYFNMMPVWDWMKLPGVTNFSGAKTIVRLPFTGGVSNKIHGLSAMDVRSSDSVIIFHAFKSWFFYKNIVISLIADLSLNQGNSALFTTLDQSRLQTDVFVNSTDKALKPGTHNLKHVKWIYHSGYAYLPLGSEGVELQMDTVTGRWSDINAGGALTAVQEKVFKPVLYHNNNSTSGYVVASVKSPEDADALAKRPIWKILSNSAVCQAISFNSRVVMATFRKNGTLNVDGNRLSVDQPCLVLLDKGQVFVSDPLHLGTHLKLTFNRKTFTVALPPDGSTIKIH